MRSYMRPLRKALSSQLALSSFGLLSLKTPILREEGTSNEEVGLHNVSYIDAEESYIAL